VLERDSVRLMAEGLVRLRPARAGSAARRVPVSDLLVLAAIDRAERQEQVDGVQWGHIPMHLGFPSAAATTRKLRLQVDALTDAGAIRQSRRRGCNVWGLTDAGRAGLAAVRNVGKLLELPEAPQHREWRQARAKAAREIEWLRDQLRSALEREQSSLSDGQADPRAWLDHGERVQGRCLQLASAYYCLHGWLEPDGAEPDTKALRGWSHAFATGTVQPGQRNQVGLANRLRQLLGASHG
jgi:hypothetical protein